MQIPGSPISAISEHPDQSTDDEEAKAKSQIGVPNVVVQAVNAQQSMVDTVLMEQVLPSQNEVLPLFFHTKTVLHV